MEMLQQMSITQFFVTGKTRTGSDAPGFLGRSVPIAG